MSHILLRRALAVVLVFVCMRDAAGEVVSEFKVHLAQANNDSPYSFVRAKFEPGEVSDPWAVSFTDEHGVDVPYFVWDAVGWGVARNGRADWGKRYALLNHGPGNDPVAVLARDEKLAWAAEHMPQVGAKLAAQERAAEQNPKSVCAAMYLLRRSVPAFGKQKLTLQIHDKPQVAVERKEWKEAEVRERVKVAQGDLSFDGLPDHLNISWKGRALLNSAGFEAGGASGTMSHVDPAQPFTISATTGIATKLVVTGKTKWRDSGSMDWQCTYWLLPEGSYVALEGFSLGQASQYRGGPQKLSIYAPAADAGEFHEVHAPSWEQPWYLHAIGERGFAATHLMHAVPLAIGYGNNPFTVNAEGPNKDPRIEADAKSLALRWFHEVNDPAISRLMGAPLVINGRSTATGQPLSGSDAESLAPIEWTPRVDWLYRQYLVGVGEKADAAEGSLRSVLGAAAGWIDRPLDEEELAKLFVGMMDEIGRNGNSGEIGLLKVVPAVLNEDDATVQKLMRDRLQDHPARTDFYIDIITRSVAAGQKPAGGGKQLPDGSRWEGWTGNPCYHASLMPVYARTLEHFDVPHSHEAYRDSILRYADFGLELLGGKPFDLEKLRTTLEAEWPSRVVPTIPLMLHAYTLKKDERYIQVAKLLFDDLHKLVERNPHGYFPVWTWTPQADKYDTVYNPVSYERGLTSFWSEELLDVIGREKASQFTAAQARWFVFSGQLLDSLELDNAASIRACTHGGHTSVRNQIGIYLYDDFAFYRGLVGDLITWSAATGPAPSRMLEMGTAPYRKLVISNAGSSMVRWALGIAPGSKATEFKLQPATDKTGFHIQAWHRRPKSKGVVEVAAKEAGLAGDGELLRIELPSPAYRRPVEIDVRRDGDRAIVTVTQPAVIRLSYVSLLPNSPGDAKPVVRRIGDKQGAKLPVEGVKHADGTVEWSAAPGEYELRRL